MTSEEKMYLVDANGAELAACGECPIGQFDEDGGCLSEWDKCYRWRTKWLAEHEYRERTCKIDMPVIDCETGETDYRCSSCGFSADPQDWAETYVYCPNCGARVVTDDD